MIQSGCMSGILGLEFGAGLGSDQACAFGEGGAGVGLGVGGVVKGQDLFGD